MRVYTQFYTCTFSNILFKFKKKIIFVFKFVPRGEIFAVTKNSCKGDKMSVPVEAHLARNRG